MIRLIEAIRDFAKSLEAARNTRGELHTARWSADVNIPAWYARAIHRAVLAWAGDCLFRYRKGRYIFYLSNGCRERLLMAAKALYSMPRPRFLLDGKIPLAEEDGAIYSPRTGSVYERVEYVADGVLVMEVYILTGRWEEAGGLYVFRPTSRRLAARKTYRVEPAPCEPGTRYVPRHGCFKILENTIEDTPLSTGAKHLNTPEFLTTMERLEKALRAQNETPTFSTAEAAQASTETPARAGAAVKEAAVVKILNHSEYVPEYGIVLYALMYDLAGWWWSVKGVTIEHNRQTNETLESYRINADVKRILENARSYFNEVVNKISASYSPFGRLMARPHVEEVEAAKKKVAEYYHEVYQILSRTDPYNAQRFKSQILDELDRRIMIVPIVLDIDEGREIIKAVIDQLKHEAREIEEKIAEIEKLEKEGKRERKMVLRKRALEKRLKEVQRILKEFEELAKAVGA